jgi:phosphoribosyl 1,2-cyclic phosphodiesterase
MIKLCVLGSGSKGNSVYINLDGHEILIDAGFSYKELGRRLELIGKDINKIKAVFVSHSHGDHNRAIPQFLKKNVNVYNNSFSAASFDIRAFQLSHDVPCHGFRIEYQNFSLIYINDTGCIPEDALRHCFGATVILIECNYDLAMLTENQKYSTDLIERIASDEGHLDNVDAGRILAELNHDNLELVVPLHLSEMNNNPALALYEAGKSVYGGKCEVRLSYQDRPTKVFYFV